MPASSIHPSRNENLLLLYEQLPYQAVGPGGPPKLRRRKEDRPAWKDCAPWVRIDAFSVPLLSSPLSPETLTILPFLFPKRPEALYLTSFLLEGAGDDAFRFETSNSSDPQEANQAFPHSFIHSFTRYFSKCLLNTHSGKYIREQNRQHLCPP